jgi:hypothetical protein
MATWGMPVPSSWLRCHRSSSLWLHLDLKPTIKRVPLGVTKGGGGEIENTKTESLPVPLEKIGGGNTTGITSGRLLHPPSGVSINTTVKINTISIS